jgi:hypothetical protein
LHPTRDKKRSIRLMPRQQWWLILRVSRGELPQDTCPRAVGSAAQDRRTARNGPLPALGVRSVKWQGSGGRSVKQLQNRLTARCFKLWPANDKPAGERAGQETTSGRAFDQLVRFSRSITTTAVGSISQVSPLVFPITVRRMSTVLNTSESNNRTQYEPVLFVATVQCG